MDVLLFHTIPCRQPLLKLVNIVPNPPDKLFLNFRLLLTRNRATNEVKIAILAPTHHMHHPRMHTHFLSTPIN